MNFEFLIACQADAETNMNQVLAESLVDALENASDYSYEDEVGDLNFSEYSNLNRRPEPKLTDILETIHNAEQYDAFRAEIRRTPVEDEVDADLIADIKEHINPIENMRNCVAHNRRPTKRITDSYPNALQTLNKRLDQYLANLSVSA